MIKAATNRHFEKEGEQQDGNRSSENVSDSQVLPAALVEALYHHTEVRILDASHTLDEVGGNSGRASEDLMAVHAHHT